MTRVPRIGSVGLFLTFAAAAVLAMQSAHGFLPGPRAGSYWGRLAILTCGAILLVAATRWLLARDGIRRDQLGLGPSHRSGAAFLIGSAMGAVHILALTIGLYMVAPFEMSRGPLTVGEVGLAGAEYLAGNFLEELLFRGYLLIALAHWVGVTRAIWLLALPFGLFHLPGLDPWALVKMLLTTGAMHFVYAYVFLITRSLWAAVAMHAVGNTLLHKVLGSGEPAFLDLHYQRALPATVDAPFLVFFGVSALFAVILARILVARRDADWLTTR
jgi:membrane protease YdiL (CAAX protease family)